MFSTFHLGCCDVIKIDVTEWQTERVTFSTILQKTQDKATKYSTTITTNSKVLTDKTIKKDNSVFLLNFSVMYILSCLSRIILYNIIYVNIHVMFYFLLFL